MRFLKVGAVIFGALIITALSIDAADTVVGNSGSMLGQLIGSHTATGCPSGMTQVMVGETFSCVDTYEVSPSQSCPTQAITNRQQTQDDITVFSCSAQSKAGDTPWTFVSRDQAQTLCMRAGKRLPTAAEWYIFAMGTPDRSSNCNIDGSGVNRTGANAQCRSAAGVYDAVGNVWEWTSDDVIEGKYNNRTLPAQGYVTQVDSAGVPTKTGATSSLEFMQDYFWTEPAGAYGILRGGFFGSNTDGGVFAVQASTVPTESTGAIGFRCVK